jgi:osmoprotectant transport system substrate-binding protein
MIDLAFPSVSKPSWLLKSAASVALLLAATFAGCHGHGNDTIVVGSKNFTEQIVLAELFAQQIEAHTSLKVERKLNLGGTLLCHQALLSGDIDVYPEYTGTALTAILHLPPEHDAAAVFQRVQREYQSRFNVKAMQPLGFNNTFAMVIRGDDARKLHLRTISGVKPLAANWKAGFGYEFMDRPDGYRGLAAAYDLHFSNTPRILDLGLLYRALMDHQVDIVAGNSTDGPIHALGLAVLEDDLHYFPPYQAVPLVRQAVIAGHPEVGAALAQLAGTISEEEMRRMNYAVDGQLRQSADVVRAFRKSKGL